MPPMSGMQVADIRERLLTKQTRVFVRQHVTEPYKTMLHYGLALLPRNRLVTLEWIRDALTQVITEKESSLIQNGEMQHRHSRYIPRYQNTHHELTTTTDEESDTVTDTTITDDSMGSASVRSVSSQRGNKIIPVPLNSTVASSTLVDISEQYSLGDIDGVMLSPEKDTPTPKPMNNRNMTNRDMSTSTVKAATPSTSSHDWSARSNTITRQSTSTVTSKPSTSSVVPKQSSSNINTKAASPAVQKQCGKEEAPISDSMSQASGDSFHTVLEMPVAPAVAPPREESFKFPDYMEASNTQQSSSSTSQEPAKKSSSSSTRKKFFRSMRRRSSGSSVSSTDGSSKSKGSGSSKSSKLSLLKSVMGKRSNSQQQNDTLGDITIDISGISKREKVSSAVREPTPLPVAPAPIAKQQTPPTSEKDDKGSQESSQQSSPSNPFKKYTNMEINTDDILSEEVKAILARPRKILKLPSFYEKRPPPRTVTGTLLYQYSGNVAFPQPLPSPPSPANVTYSHPPAADNPPAVTVHRRSSTTIVPSAQASWMDTSLTANYSLPVAAVERNSSTVPLTESCPKLSTTAPEPMSRHDDTDNTFHHDIDDSITLEHNETAVNASYKPASRLVPSPVPRKVTPEPVSYHVPSPTPSPRTRMTQEDHSPSPIAPVRRREGATLQRTSTTLPTRTTVLRTSGSIKEEWLQAYAGAAVPPGVTQDPFLKYRAARRASSRYRSVLHEAMSEQNTAPTQSPSFREVQKRSLSYHNSPSVLPQRTGAQGAIDCSSKGPIKNIIASFQGKLEEHLQKQAILQLKKRTPNDKKKDTFTSETFHTPSKGKELKIPQCSDEQLQLSLEGGPSYRIITPGTTVSTANITLQKTVPLKKPVPSPRTSHKQAFAESLRHIEQNHVEKDEQSSATSMTYTPRSMESTEGGDSDSSGSELSDYIGRVLSSCHQSVVDLYKHPNCQHTSTVEKRYSSSHIHEDIGDGGLLHRSPAHTTRAGLLLTNNDNSNNSTSASSTRCASDTGLSASGKRSESEMSARSEGSRQRSIEEFYFDDELQPGVKSRNLNLENSSGATSTDGELDSFLQGDRFDFRTPPVQTPVAADDYDGTPYKTLDITDYKKFKQERKITRLTEDESGNSEDLIVTV